MHNERISTPAADPPLLRDIANAALSSCDTDGLVCNVSLSVDAAHRLRSLADALEKITREDVAFIRDKLVCLTGWINYGEDPEIESDARRRVALAAKLAALLPP